MIAKRIKKPTVFVGLSGGIDSSTTAYLLLKQGYKVVGVYMKNWSQDIGSYRCPWRQDYLAAKRLAAYLDIKFLVFDFQKQYKQLVVEHMIAEYEKGNTPNPDIRCNQEIKFNLFLQTCLDRGADLVATGHYARIIKSQLHKAADKNKDQTYFLYRINPQSLDRILFPVGDYLKTQIRELALKAKLPNALRSESMGLCFVGQVGLADFLKQYVKTAPGLIIDKEQGVVGQHPGAIFYTLGQRRGLNIGGGLPYYVVDKDMSKNEVYVSRNLQNSRLWYQALDVVDLHWLSAPRENKSYDLRIRHGGNLVKARFSSPSQDKARLYLNEPVKAATPGQAAVLYRRGQVIGGGVICHNE